MKQWHPIGKHETSLTKKTARDLTKNRAFGLGAFHELCPPRLRDGSLGRRPRRSFSGSELVERGDSSMDA